MSHRFKLKEPREQEPSLKGPAVPVSERWLVGLVSVHLVFLPWALGGAETWAQLLSLALALVSLGLALASSAKALPRLLRFPLFWLGLAFFLLVGLQALNPAWKNVVPGGRAFRMVPLAHFEWLPSGITGLDWSLIPPGIAVLTYLSAWLLVCALWVGLSRRRCVLWLLNTVALNGLASALFGLVWHQLGNGKLLGFVDAWRDATHWGSFIYRNHAGAYLNLTLGACLALAYFHHRASSAAFAKSSPAGVYLFLSGLPAASVLLSGGRAATLNVLGILALGALYFFFTSASAKCPKIDRFLIAVFCAVFLAFGAFVYRSLELEKPLLRAFKIVQEQDLEASAYIRKKLAASTFELAKEKPVFGHGLGSFRFLFPRHQIKDPELAAAPAGRIGVFYRHAHNDWLEFLAEVGIVGLSLIGAGLAYGAHRLWVVRRSNPGANVFLVLGLGSVLAHAAVDFPFQNPAVVVSFSVVAGVVLREFEPRH